MSVVATLPLKPLDWRKDGSDTDPEWIADSVLGRWTAWESGGRWIAAHPDGRRVDAGARAEEAKRAIEAEYRRLMAPALAPSPDAEAMRSACRVAVLAPVAADAPLAATRPQAEAVDRRDRILEAAARRVDACLPAVHSSEEGAFVASLDALRRMVAGTSGKGAAKAVDLLLAIDAVKDAHDAERLAGRPWRPGFDAMVPEQERLAIEFCVEIAGLKGRRGSPPDPVRLLEMAESLYRAEAAAVHRLDGA